MACTRQDRTNPITSNLGDYPVTKAEYQQLVQIAHDADADWQAELGRMYGKRAGEARYDDRGRSTADLQHLFAEKVRTDAVRHNALMDSFVAGNILA